MCTTRVAFLIVQRQKPLLDTAAYTDKDQEESKKDVVWGCVCLVLETHHRLLALLPRASPCLVMWGKCLFLCTIAECCAVIGTELRFLKGNVSPRKKSPSWRACTHGSVLRGCLWIGVVCGCVFVVAHTFSKSLPFCIWLLHGDWDWDVRESDDWDAFGNVALDIKVFILPDQFASWFSNLALGATFGVFWRIICANASHSEARTWFMNKCCYAENLSRFLCRDLQISSNYSERNWRSRVPKTKPYFSNLAPMVWTSFVYRRPTGRQPEAYSRTSKAVVAVPATWQPQAVRSSPFEKPSLAAKIVSERSWKIK